MGVDNVVKKYISHYHLIELGLDGRLLVTRRTGEVVDTPSLKDFQVTQILSRNLLISMQECEIQLPQADDGMRSKSR